MTMYCRLCAELKDSSEIIASIDDSKRSIEQKLVACCQWNVDNNDQIQTQDVCMFCLDKLEESWLFSQSVQLAQYKLLEIFENENKIKSTTDSHVDDLIKFETDDCNVELIPDKYEMDANDFISDDVDSEIGENIFIEPIALPQPTINNDINNKVESKRTKKDKSKPRRNYQCRICQKKFTASSNLRKHEQIHSDKRPYCCPQCEKCFKTSSNLNQHLRKVHKMKTKYKKKKTDQTNDSKKLEPNSIESNLEMKKPVQPKPELKHACNFCEKRFKSNYLLTVHEMIHYDERPYECYICHNTSRQKSALKKHMELHTQMPQIECNVCGKHFRTKYNIESHMKMRHRLVDPITKKKISYETPEKKFTCELCGMTFSQKGGLNSHMKTAHSDLRPHKCEVCGLGFKLKIILNSHLRTHTKLEYKCNQCDKAFRKEISLQKHMEYHTGTVIKPFVCDICGKAFRLNFNLGEHRRIHTGEKPYNCEHCPSNFRTMSSFYSHLKKEHGISVLAKKLEEQARATAMS